MALLNLVKVNTATVGTGTMTLGTAVTGFLTMSQAGAVDGTTYSYGISDGTNSEAGTGVYTAAGATLTRNVANSTNGNAAVSLSGTAQVFITALAGDYGSSVTVVTKSAGYTETTTSGEMVILANLSAGFTIALPTAVGNTAKFTVKKLLASGTITIHPNGAQTIDGGATASLTQQYQAITFVSDNANWWII